jgi:hypothetical protein
MTTLKQNGLPSLPTLWTALPDCQQELLSGGSPRLPRPPVGSPPPVSPPGLPGAPPMGSNGKNEGC